MLAGRSTSPSGPRPSAPRLLEIVALAVVALVVRAGAALAIDYAPYTDPAYYAMVAGELARGHGFVAPALWSFLEVGGRLPSYPDPLAGLPVPSNGHWMPLTSIVSAPWIELLGGALGEWRAAELPMILLSAWLVPFTYLVGWQLWGSRSVAWGGAVLALLGGPLLVYYPLPDNFAVFGVLGATALWCSIQAVVRPRPGPWLVAAGGLAGLATLARIDGMLLVVAPAVAWWLRRDSGALAGRLAWGAASAGAFAAVLAPWLLRNLQVFGAAFPSAGGHTLLITEYNQQFSISLQPGLESFLSAGLPALIGQRLATWGELIGRTAVLLGGLFVAPFAWSLWAERRRPELAPFLAYFVLMFVVMGAVFTLHAPKGAFYHSAPAWLPFAMPMAVAGLAPAATAAGRWWAFLRRPATHAFLLVAGLVGAVALSVIGSIVLLIQWGDAHDRLAAAAEFMRGANPDHEVVMVYDAPGWWLLTGDPAVAPPYDAYPVIGQVVEAYDVGWVVVTLRPGESRDPLGLWGGGGATDAGNNHPEFMPLTPAFEDDRVRVYRIADSSGE